MLLRRVGVFEYGLMTLFPTHGHLLEPGPEADYRECAVHWQGLDEDCEGVLGQLDAIVERHGA